MIQWVYLLLLVCVGSTLLVIVVEEPRFQQCYAVCKRKHYRNGLLLKSDVCKDDYVRSELDGEHVSCTRAEEEVNLGIHRCAIRKWWQEGEPVALYHRVLGSPYMIYALLMPTIIFVIYQIFAYCADIRRENKIFSEFHSFANTFAFQQQQPPPPQVETLRYVSQSHKELPFHKQRLTNREMREQALYY